MKYSFMTFSCPDLTLDECLALARRLGYDGIEPRTVNKHKHGIEVELSSAERARIRQKVKGSGVVLACIATSHSYADPTTAGAQVEATVASAQLAADVGAPCIRVFGGKIPAGIQRAQAIEGVANSLKAIAKKVKGLGVTICMETHDDWCDPTHVAEVMKRVNEPCIAVNWDIMHPVRVAKKSIEESFQTLKPWIRHVHFHDGITVGDQLRLVPIGQGEVDHRTAVRLLKKSGYTGYLSGEWISWEPYETHLPRELATMKGYEREA